MLNDDNDYCVWRCDSLRLLGFWSLRIKDSTDINFHWENRDRWALEFRYYFKNAEWMKVENLWILSDFICDYSELDLKRVHL